MAKTAQENMNFYIGVIKDQRNSAMDRIAELEAIIESVRSDLIEARDQITKLTNPN